MQPENRLLWIHFFGKLIGSHLRRSLFVSHSEVIWCLHPITVIQVLCHPEDFMMQCMQTICPEDLMQQVKS